MALKTKQFYGEQVMLGLSSSLRNRDERLDIREAYIAIDKVVNRLAKENFLVNWKFGFGQLDEQFLTRWEWLTVTDPANEGNSYVPLPANYAALPKSGGIFEVYFQNDFTNNLKRYFDPIHVVSQRERIMYRNNMAGSLQGRLSVAPINGNLVFNTGNIGATYGNIGLALVIKDSTQINDNSPYPIPAEIEDQVIKEAIAFLRERRNQMPDLARDNNDSKNTNAA